MSIDLASQQSLRVTTDTQSDLVVLSVEGELDIATCELLEAAITNALSRRPRAVAIDMAGVGFLGKAGASTVLECWYRATRQRTRLGIVNPSPAALRVLRAMRLEGVLVRDPSIISGTTRSY